MQDLLRKLNTLNITINLKGDQLDIKSPRGAMTAELLEEIKQYKKELISFLGEYKIYDNNVITKTSLKENYTLSSSQYRLWLLHEIGKENTTYNMPSAFRIKDAISVADIEKALLKLIERHEILRTNFEVDEKTGKPVQCISPIGNICFKLNYFDFSQESNREEKFEKIKEKEVGHHFDLKNDSLIRVSLIKMHEDEYILIFILHHIISDGWSSLVIIKDLFSIYQSLFIDEKIGLQPLSIQYKDYAEWQQTVINSKEIVNHKNYWKTQFKGNIPITEIPSNKPRPSIKTYNGATITKEFNGNLIKDFQKLCSEQGATLFMGFLTLTKILFYKYTSQTDIIIGSPNAGRELTELQDQIGFYVNILALKTSFNNRESFNQLLRKVKKTTLDANQYQDYPFDELIQELNLPSDRSRNPLFNTILSVETNKENTLKPPTDFNIKELNLGDKTSKFDLEFIFNINQNSNDLSLTYNTDLYYEEFVVQITNHLERLLIETIEAPDVTINKLNCLTEKEKTKLLNEFNNTSLEYPKNKTFVDLFEEQVLNTPNNTAIVCNGNCFTYSDLNEISNQLANHLIVNHNISTKDFVGVKIQRSEWLIISFLAIIKTGAVYIPIDIDYPQDRIDFIEKDSNCKLIIDQNFINEFVNKEKTDKSKPKIRLENSSLVYIIYTSGSTGKPKGVMISHQNLVNLCFWHKKQYAVNELSKGTLFSGIAFDASIWEMCPYLLFGASLYPITEQNIRLDINELCNFLNENKITHSYLPTTISNQLVIHDKIIENTIVLTGGDILRLQKKPNFKLYNNYGPTENTVVTTFFDINDEYNSFSIPIGKPISNTKIYILDDNLELLPIGISGKLYVSGDGVAKGYLNHQELTAEKFIVNPFIEGERMYDTGDFAKWLCDGNIEFIGRKDDQVKLRGYRIELGEIENVILLFSKEITQAAVIIKKVNNTETLIAYYVEKETVDHQALKNYLKEKLPGYMIPSYLMALETIPLTPNGKVDRKSLPSVSEEHIVKRKYVAPHNEIQRILVEVWQEVLKIENIGITDNFFELGGDSMKISQVASIIAKKKKIKIGLNIIFSNPTIDSLSLKISELNKADIKNNLDVYTDIVKINIEEDYDLSFAQKRFWFLSNIEADTSSLNLTGRFEFPVKFEREVFIKAFMLLVDRHEILRTIFITRNNKPKQKILAINELNYNSEFEIVHSDTVRIHKFEEEVFKQAYRLDQWPLFKVVIVEEINKSNILFSMSHIISDGWSMEVFKRDLLAIYKSLLDNTSSDLPELRIQHKDYAKWENTLIESPFINNQKQYWLEKLESPVAKLKLPYDIEKDSNELKNSGSYYITYINESTKNSIRQFTAKTNVRLLAVLVSCFKIVLNRLTNEKDIILGIPVSIREHIDLKNQIGPFLNTILLRNNLDESDSFIKFLRQVNDNLIDSLEHKLYPLEKIIEHLDFERDFNTNFTSVFFNLLDFDSTNETVLENLNPKLGLIPNAVKFDLECYVKSFTNGIAINCVYKNELFKQETISHWINKFIAVVTEVVSNPDIIIEELEIFDHSIHESSEVIIDRPFEHFEKEALNQSIVSRFEEQVEKNPEKLALVEEDGQMTYLELNGLANTIANKLVEALPNGKNRIALLLDHGRMAVSGILGVLKSGNAYVPLHTEYPENKLDAIIKTTDSKLILCDGQYIKIAEKLANKNNIELVNLSKIIDKKTEPVNLAIEPIDEAYILFTSGSTGLPKGVVQNHRNVIHFARIYANNLKISKEDRVCLLSTYSFDGSVIDIFSTLLMGATLYPFNLKKKGLASLEPWLNSQQISIYHTVPTIYRTFVTDLAEKSFPSIRLVILGGEAVFKSDFELFKKYFQEETIFVNVYGCAESSMLCQKLLNHNSVVTTRRIPLGSTLEDSSFYILNNGKLTKDIYQVGEIIHSNAHLALGYINQEDLTKKVFVNDLLEERNRCYKSGDIGRIMPNGEIEFLNRKDSQVKLNGIRIELTEIEQNILELEEIDQVVVLTKEYNGKMSLVVYLSKRHHLMEAKIQQFLRGRLPMFMVPNLFVYLDKFPLTRSGKISRIDLPEVSLKNDQNSLVAPRNMIEYQLLDIWKEILGIEELGITNNFFKVGGDSIRVMTLSDKILTTFGFKVSLHNFFEYATIRDFYEQYNEEFNTTNNTTVEEVPIQEMINLPLSPQQQNMIYYEGINITSYNDNCELRFSIPQQVSIEVLKKAIIILVKRHENLRGHFYQEDGNTYQQFDDEYIPEIIRLEKEEVLKGDDFYFDLTECPPYKIFIRDQKNDGIELLIIISHLIVDEYSLQILYKEFSIVCKKILVNDENIFETPSLKYSDFVKQQWHLRTTPAFLEMEKHWEQLIDPNIKSPVFYDLDKNKNRSAFGLVNVYHVRLDQESGNRLINYSKNIGIPIFNIIHAVYAYTIYTLSGNNDFLIGSIFSGRNSEQMVSLVGFTTTTAMISCKIEEEMPLINCIENINKQILKSLESIAYQYEDLVKKFDLDINEERMPLTDLYINVKRVLGTDPDLKNNSHIKTPKSQKYDMLLILTIDPDDQFGISINYRRDIIEPEEIENFVQKFSDIIKEMLGVEQITNY
ncbi:non-ribosomal peptide synthetase [Aquimarina sp. RZ0]|uniref:non-ribosomal peptide synthetase n=1 Tax=Aquimarina sp. RZ0 TaxID=2607730 RepID=UPI0011F342B6|nr:non-ribosomal peptide synthetase [Aquimarina sp. RZ0]KAA1243795.1 amino acid adenylation domain-containing protein [Aquimarina sp. RZ0]